LGTEGLFWTAVDSKDTTKLILKRRNYEPIVKWCSKNNVKILGVTDLTQGNTVKECK
jgi:hypothetical protein